MINRTANVLQGTTEKGDELDITKVKKNRIITNKIHQSHTVQNRKILKQNYKR